MKDALCQNRRQPDSALDSQRNSRVSKKGRWRQWDRRGADGDFHARRPTARKSRRGTAGTFALSLCRDEKSAADGSHVQPSRLVSAHRGGLDRSEPLTSPRVPHDGAGSRLRARHFFNGLRGPLRPVNLDVLRSMELRISQSARPIEADELFTIGRSLSLPKPRQPGRSSLSSAGLGTLATRESRV